MTAPARSRVLRFAIFLRFAIVPLGAALVYLLLTLLCGSTAHADTVTDTNSIDAELAVWLKDGPWWAGLAVLYAALHVFLNKQHWLAKGRLLAVLTGISMVLAAILNWRFAGAPVSGIFTAVLAAVALIKMPTVSTSPVPAPAPGDTTPSPTATSAGDTASSAAAAATGGAAALVLVVIGLGAGAMLGSGCTPTRNVFVDAGHTVVDCVRADAGPVEQLLVELGADAINQVLGVGKPDWDALEARAEVQGAVIGGCAFAEFVHGRKPAPPAVATHDLGSSRPSPDPALVSLERLRAKSGGVRWSTPSGVI